eukprot:Clim_evm35s155 gene=Clim_evmTU35s155
MAAVGSQSGRIRKLQAEYLRNPTVYLTNLQQSLADVFNEAGIAVDTTSFDQLDREEEARRAAAEVERKVQEEKRRKAEAKRKAAADVYDFDEDEEDDEAHFATSTSGGALRRAMRDDEDDIEEMTPSTTMLSGEMQQQPGTTPERRDRDPRKLSPNRLKSLKSGQPSAVVAGILGKRERGATTSTDHDDWEDILAGARKLTQANRALEKEQGGLKKHREEEGGDPNDSMEVDNVPKESSPTGKSEPEKPDSGGKSTSTEETAKLPPKEGAAGTANAPHMIPATADEMTKSNAEAESAEKGDNATPMRGQISSQLGPPESSGSHGEPLTTLSLPVRTKTSADDESSGP